MSQAHDPNVSMDANGTLSTSESIKLDDSQGKSGAMNIIIMLAIGILGTKMVMYKKRTMDMTIATVGSVAYIAGEVLNIKSLKDRIAKDQKSTTDGSASGTTDGSSSASASTGSSTKPGGLQGDTFVVNKSSDGKNDSAQIESLQKLKKSYEDAKKSAKTRKMLQMASAAAFGLAGVLALYQMVTLGGKKLACETAIKTSQVVLSACVANIPTEAAGCIACQAQVSALSVSINASDAKAATPAPSVPLLTIAEAKLPPDMASAAAPCPGATAQAQKSKVTSACQSYLTTRHGYEAGGPIAMFSTASNNSKWLNKMLFSGISFPEQKMSVEEPVGDKNLLQKMMNVLVPTAEASGWMGLLGLGAGAALALMTAKGAMGKTIDNFIFNPGLRAVLWGVLAAAALAASKATQKEMDKIDENLKKINQILADMATLQNGIKPNSPTEQVLDTVAFDTALKNSDSTSISPDPNLSIDCVANPGGTNCASVTDQVKAMPGFADLPDTLKSATTQTTKLGDSLSGASTISGTTLGAANTLASKTNAISKLNKSLVGKLNAIGKNPDLTRKGQELFGQLRAQTRRALSSSNMTPNGFLSSMGMTPPPSSDGAGNSVDSNKKYLSGSPVSAIGGGQFNGAAKDKSLDLDFKEMAAVPEAVKEGAAAKEEKFDLGLNDVNTNSGENIFQVISNRYFKSGYPKLLEIIPDDGKK
jgi:hypothetical protein